jgi:hypothetical protein
MPSSEVLARREWDRIVEGIAAEVAGLGRELTLAGRVPGTAAAAEMVRVLGRVQAQIAVQLARLIDYAADYEQIVGGFGKDPAS